MNRPNILRMPEWMERPQTMTTIGYAALAAAGALVLTHSEERMEGYQYAPSVVAEMPVVEIDSDDILPVDAVVRDAVFIAKAESSDPARFELTPFKEAALGLSASIGGLLGLSRRRIES